MIDKPLISVVLPIYNVEKYISRCVDSVINQTYKNLEIILVDDGSPDNCPKICDKYSNFDNRIKVIHKENGGLSDARNAGMNVANGEYIAFIDSDDFVDINMISDLYNRMTCDNSDIVSCGVKWVYNENTIDKLKKSDNCEVLDTETAMKELLVDGKLKQHVWNKLYKTELVKDVLFEKGKYHEDVFWSYQVIAKSSKVSVMQSEYYYYIQRPNSIMGEEYSNKRLDALDAMKQRCDFIKDNFYDLYNLALSVYMNSCMYHLQCALKSDKTKTDRIILKNILERLHYKQTGNIFECLKGKQVFWLRMFFIFPKMTCKLRNFLKIGI